MELFNYETLAHFVRAPPMRPNKHLLLVTSLAATCCLRGEDPPKDLQILQGKWAATDAELGGKKFPDDAIKTMSLAFDGAQYISRLGEKADRGNYKIDGNTSPKSIEFTSVKGPNAGKTFVGIYELEERRLRVCLDLGGKHQPKDFETTDKPERVSVIYEREPDD